MNREPSPQRQAKLLTPAQVRALYHERMEADFPPDELKPLSMMEALLSQKRYDCYGFFEGDDILAYAYFVRLGRWALLDYYAVRDDLRDTGVGSAFLQGLIGGPLQGLDCVLVEVDDPDAAPDPDERTHRERRRQFYLRNGLWDTGVRVWLFFVDYRVLAMPAKRHPLPEAIREIYAALYHSMLTDEFYDKWVRL